MSGVKGWLGYLYRSVKGETSRNGSSPEVARMRLEISQRRAERLEMETDAKLLRAEQTADPQRAEAVGEEVRLLKERKEEEERRAQRLETRLSLFRRRA